MVVIVRMNFCDKDGLLHLFTIVPKRNVANMHDICYESQSISDLCCRFNP